ncbi:unnamed protein product [Mycena citricolor]|uniref:Uncharacterized protein n=1 Tax=Mycena citricolor TaxID=2018698 RepID=A0AAD2HSE3_9AGAR|nr:unnamed protein product [Mycena citricolor]
MSTTCEKASSDSLAKIRDLPFANSSEAMARLPTAEEQNTLRRVAGRIPWAAYLICLVEFAERASYYGCAGVFANFIQRPLPEGGNGAGAPPRGTQETAGALGLGLVAATGLSQMFTFLAYTLPIVGGILADTRWGRFKTICIGTAIGAVAHVTLVLCALPAVISAGHALAPFIVSILLLALGTGCIKTCIAPIIVDQSTVMSQSVVVLPSGEKVIVDPGATIQSMLMIYYWSVNIGGFFSVATSYAEKRVGFWLAYLVPGILYMLMPITLVIVYPKLVRLPPQGSVVLDAFRVFRTIFERAGLKGMLKGGDNWNLAKPVCRSFVLADGGVSVILANQGASMTTDGAPNDLLSNFNALTIVVAIPLLNFLVYPALRHVGINFSPIRRIVFGFLVTAAAMVMGAVVQWRVYQTSPCGYHASTCTIGTGVSPISVWVQIPLYALPALAEIFIIVTAYEIAYTSAPRNMKGVVMGLVLFTNAISSAIMLVISPVFVDPNLIWPFVALAGVLLLSAVLIWAFFRDVDRDSVSVERE